jgi:hypothetical protein
MPVICDGGFSKWLAPRYVLLSLAMLWNQLNYITTSTYLTVQVHDLINLFRNALVTCLCPLPLSPWNLRPTAFLRSSQSWYFISSSNLGLNIFGLNGWGTRIARHFLRVYTKDVLEGSPNDFLTGLRSMERTLTHQHRKV